MTENSYLNGKTLVEQNLGIIYNLEKDNEILIAAENSLASFIEEDEIKSNAFINLKQQISDYVEIIRGLRSANDSDIADFKTLNSIVGDSILDGAVITEGKERAKRLTNIYCNTMTNFERQAEKYNILGCASIVSLHYLIKAQYYAALIEDENDIYNEYLSKENMYDLIVEDSDSLFMKGGITRSSAQYALEDMKANFVDGKYHIDITAKWRTRILESYYKRMCTINSDGSVKLNMYEIKKTLRKDATNIMPREYEAITKAFMLANDNEMTEIVLCMFGDAKKVEREYICIFDNGTSIYNREHCLWEMDQDKLKNISLYAQAFADEILVHQQKARENSEKDLVHELLIERKIILQRATLLNALATVNCYRGKYDDKSPGFNIETIYNKNGGVDSLEVSICQSSKPTSMGNYDERWSAITIEGTDTSSEIVSKVSKKVVYDLGYQFGSYSAQSDVVEFVFEQIEDKFVETMANETGKILGGKLSLVMPYIFATAELGVDIYDNVKEAERQVEYIEDGIEVIDSVQGYAYFDCDANYVTYNTIESTETVIYPYVGEFTDEKILDFNLKCGLEVNRERIFCEPCIVKEEVDNLLENPSTCGLASDILKNRD